MFSLFDVIIFYLRWLNIVLRAVSSSASIKLEKQTWRRKERWYKEDYFSKSSLTFCDIWQNFHFYLISNNDNFKMEVKRRNFVTHLIITVQ